MVYSVFFKAILFAFFFLEVCLANECPKNQYWINPYKKRAYIKADGTRVSASNVVGHCRSKSKSFEMWSDRLKNVAPDNWPHKNELFGKWNEEERERLLEVFDSLPFEIQMDSVKSIHRAKKSKDYPNPATSADGVIVLYDNVFDSNRSLARTLAHELAHQLYRDMSSEQKTDYRFATNWLPIDLEAGSYISRKNGYVQDDGRESPEEDFANNIEYYLFERKTLEKVTPQASRWIKAVYGDKLKVGKGVLK